MPSSGLPGPSEVRGWAPIWPSNFPGRRLSRSSVLGLDLAYLRLGSETRRGATITLPPEAAPATFTSSSRHRLYLFGLALDQQLVRAPPAPSFFLGVGYYGVDASSRFTVRDTLGLIDRQSTIEGTSWGPGLSLGLGLRLPTLGHGLRPRVQLRGHVMVVKTEDSWAEYDALSLGLGQAW